jgi:hypothetical protein
MLKSALLSLRSPPRAVTEHGTLLQKNRLAKRGLKTLTKFTNLPIHKFTSCRFFGFFRGFDGEAGLGFL